MEWFLQGALIHLGWMVIGAVMLLGFFSIWGVFAALKWIWEELAKI